MLMLTSVIVPQLKTIMRTTKGCTYQERDSAGNDKMQSQASGGVQMR
jgi:hypothetical protein